MPDPPKIAWRRPRTSFYIASAAVTLALYRARQAVKDALRRKGEKVSSFAACEITAMAKAYLAEHRELVADARAKVERWTLEGVFGKRAQRAWAEAESVRKATGNRTLAEHEAHNHRTNDQCRTQRQQQ
jgi:hypothetical protein